MIAGHNLDRREYIPRSTRRIDQVQRAGHPSVMRAHTDGVAILSRLPIEHVTNALSGDESDTHACYLEVIVSGVRIVDIYLPNGISVGTEKFEYKLAWMGRFLVKMSQWKADGVPTSFCAEPPQQN